MVKITKYLFACVVLVASREATAAPLIPECEYVLCRTKDQKESTGYHASGSAISSQFLMPDGSVVTNSKEVASSSGGIKQTFYELKKEADKFVHNKEVGDAIRKTSFAQFPKISIPSNIPEFPNAFNGLQTDGVQNSYAQSQSSSSVKQTGSQLYQQAVPLKISSYSKEHETEKKVVSSQGPLSFASENIVSQYTDKQQSGVSTGTAFNNVVHLPSETSFTQNKESEHFQQHHSGVHIPVVSGSQTSYETYESSSQKNASGVQSNVFSNLKPNTISTHFIELSQEKGLDGVIRLPQIQNVPTSESHYDVSGITEQKEHKYNAIPIETAYSQYEHDDQIKMDEFSVKPAGALVSSVQQGNYQINTASLPTAHIEQFTVRLNAPAANSQTYQEKEISSSSQTSSGRQVPVISVPLSYTKNSQYNQFDGIVYSHSQSVPASTFESYENQGSSSHVLSSQQVPTAPVQSSSFISTSKHQGSTYSQKDSSVPVISEQISSHDKNALSLQSYGYQSPVLLHGVPQDVQFPIPLLVHGVPQTQSQSFSSSSDSRSGSHYSSSKVAGSVYPSGLYNDADLSQKVRGASSSIYDKHSENSEVENLCASCIGGISSSNMPIKNSYAVSKSFSSNSKTINGQMTENREASVAVNDNGKVDSYHVRS